MESRDIYLRHTDKKGKSWVQQHRVWDAALFMQSQDADARKESGSVELATESDYAAQRAKKG